jgi:hypothetical protein
LCDCAIEFIKIVTRSAKYGLSPLSFADAEQQIQFNDMELFD